MEKRENIDIGVALLTIRDICRNNIGCVNCPMEYFCYRYFIAAPYKWNSEAIPKLDVNLEY